MVRLPSGYRAEHRIEHAFPERVRVDERQIEIGDHRIDLETFEVSRGEAAWFDGFSDLVHAARHVVASKKDPRQVKRFSFSRRFDELEVVAGPGVTLPKNDTAHQTLSLDSTFSEISISVSCPGEDEDRIALIADERARRAFALNLDRGPHTVQTKRMRVEFDGVRIQIERRGMIPFVQSIDLRVRSSEIVLPVRFDQRGTLPS